MDLVRTEVGALCGAPAGTQTILAASGTDLHLIAAELARRDSRMPLTSVMADPAETGRGVPAALCGLGFGAETPIGGAQALGDPISGAVPGRALTVALRRPDGSLRPAAEIDAAFEAACDRAARTRGHILLVMVDGSKTGLTAPSPACAAALKARHGDRLDVLVDACQLRLSEASLAAHLAEGFLVAVTGSKFIGGPAYSGALLVPEGAVERLSDHLLAHGVGRYSARGDWPAGWTARRTLPDAANPGLQARWRAGLHELAAFRALPQDAIAGFLRAFAATAAEAIAAAPNLAAVEVRTQARAETGAWDGLATIFPFQILKGGAPESAERTGAIFRALLSGAEGQPVELGQPVSLGRGATALRLCVGARTLRRALSSSDEAEAVLIEARMAIAATALAAR
jgi:hypothetical protein